MRAADGSRKGAARRGAVPLSDALSGWRRAHPRRGKIMTLRTRWDRAVGPSWAAWSRPASLRAGRLRIEVASSAVLAELATLRSSELLAAIRAVEPGIRSLSFAVGEGPWGASS